MGENFQDRQAEEIPQKMTLARLKRALEDLQLNYKIEGEGRKFDIVISSPEKHILEKAESASRLFVSDANLTEYDREQIMPLIRRINCSTNLSCELNRRGGDYVISVEKKFV